MGKGIECVTAVEGTHTAIADPAKWQFGYGLVDHNVVHKDAARAYVANYSSLQRTIFSEEIECQRFGSRSYEAQGFFHCLISNDRQNRTKYLFLQDCCAGRQISEHGWRDVPICRVRVASNRDPAFLHERKEPCKMLLVHNAPVRLAAMRIGSIESRDCPLKVVDQQQTQRLRYKNVIGSYANLTGIHKAAPDNTAGRYFERG